VDVEFRHETLTMFFDRLDADAEFRAVSLLSCLRQSVGAPPFRGSEASDFLFEQPAAVQRLRLMIAEALGNGRAEKGVSVLNFPNCLGQVVGGGLFEQKTTAPTAIA